MVRRLAGITAVACSVWASAGFALGLGEISIKSGLHEGVVATVAISSASKKELDSLSVQLASNEDFERAGLDRPEFLSQLKFEVRDRTIHISSTQAAREPFLMMLLDVRWNGGRLMREYTVLLDPPSYTLPPPKSVLPAALPAGATEAQPIAPPAADGKAVEAQPMAPAPTQSAPVSATPVLPPVDDTAFGGVDAAPEFSAAPSTAATYGPVKPKETLWSIAFALRPDAKAITMDQMQVALLRANPAAFHDGKLNGLMKGVTLKVPSRAEILAVDAATAKRQVSAARGSSAAFAAPPPEPSPVPATRPATTTAPVTPAAVAPVQKEAKPAPVESKPAPPPTPAPAPAAVEPEPMPEPVVEPATAAPAEAEKPAPTAAPPPLDDAAMFDEPTTAPAPVSTLDDDAMYDDVESPDASAAEAAIETQALAQPESAPIIAEPSLLDTVMEKVKGLGDNPLLMPIAIGGALLLGLLLGGRRLRDAYAQWSYERASRKERGEPVSMDDEDDGAAAAGAGVSTVQALQDAADEATQIAPVADAPPTSATVQMEATAVEGTQSMPEANATQAGAPPAAVEETQAQSGSKLDFDVSGQFASETVQISVDAGDPLSEAEFHRAYGLYDEAILLLKQAMKKEPGRGEIKVKLAEIYFETSKAEEFVSLAKELKGELPAEEWQSVALMGSQIAADDPLFKDAAAGGIGSGGVDLSFDEPAEAAPQETVSDVGLPDVEAAPAEAPADDGGMLDFDIGDMGAAEAAPAEEPAEEPVADLAEGLEFNLDDASLGMPDAEGAAEVSVEGPPADPIEEGLDLGEFDLSADDSSADAALDLAADGPELVDDSAGGGGQDDSDEAGTKLDLARAYMDMGDNDMAKSLLNEVLGQGNDQQKKEAEELLQRVPA